MQWSEEAAAGCGLAVCVSLHVWSAGDSIGNEGCASLCTALQQNKTLTSFTIGGMLCSGMCSVQVIGVRWCKCSGAVITGCWLGRLQFGSGYCGLQHGMLHCNDVTGFGGGSCLPPLSHPPHPHTYRGVRERRGLCDFFSWTCGAEAVAYDAPVQYAGEPNALCVMLNCGGLPHASSHVRRKGATHMPEDNNSAWQALMDQVGGCISQGQCI